MDVGEAMRFALKSIENHPCHGCLFGSRPGECRFTLHGQGEDPRIGHVDRCFSFTKSSVPGVFLGLGLDRLCDEFCLLGDFLGRLRVDEPNRNHRAPSLGSDCGLGRRGCGRNTLPNLRGLGLRRRSLGDQSDDQADRQDCDRCCEHSGQELYPAVERKRAKSLALRFLLDQHVFPP